VTHAAALSAFAAGALLIGYTYIGYPLVLWVWSRLRARPVRRGEYQPRLSVIVAMHNEARVIAEKCRNLLALDYPEHLLEIVVVSDGSTDGSAERVRALRGSRLRLVEYAPRRGKAWALNCGVDKATGEILLFTDARQALPADAARRLAENFADPEVGAVSGELKFFTETSAFGGALSRYWSYEKWVRRTESEIDSVCGVTGCLWAMRRELYTEAPEGLILDDVFQPMEVVRRGRRVVFDARAVAFDQPSENPEIEYQRKRRTLLGNYQLLKLSPWILRGQNRIRFQFLSHKVCRLLVPVALLAVFVSSFLLEGIFFRGLFYAQLAFYVLGLLERWLPAGTALRKLAALSSFFTVVHVSALAGFARWLAGAQDVWSKPSSRGAQPARHP